MSDPTPSHASDSASGHTTATPEGFFAGPRFEASLRRRRVARVRQAIEANDYENELKLSIAADRILDRLFQLDDSEESASEE